MNVRHLSLILAFTLAACTEKGKPYAEHVGDQRHTAPTTIISTPPTAESRGESQSDLSLATLAERVLSVDRLNDSQALTSRQNLEELNELNRRLLAQSNSEQEEFQKILNRYGQMIGYECEGFVDGCKGLRYFKRSPASSEIAKILAKRSSNQRFRYLLLSLKLKSSDWDPEIAQLLLQTPVAPDEVAHYQAALSLLEMNLQLAAQKIPGAYASKKFLQSIQIWSLLANPHFKLTDSTNQALLAMISSSGILEQNGQLNPDAKPFVESIQKNENSVFQRQQRLAKIENSVQPIREINLIPLLSDAVFTGRLTFAGAAALSGQNVEPSVIEAEVINYVRLQFLATLSETSKEAERILAAPIQAEDLLAYVQKESAGIQNLWGQLKSRLGVLKAFALQAAGSRATETGQRLSRFFNSLDRSILVSSTYPQQMILFYRLSQKNFSVEVDIMGRSMRFDSADLVSSLFSGELKPILRYAEEQEPLKTFEVLYAFDIALRSGLFASASIDVDNFMSQILTRLTQARTTHIRTVLDRIGSQFEHSRTYTQFKEACEEFSSKRLAERRIYLNEVGLSPYYGDLLNDVFTAVPTSPGAPTSSPALFFLNHDFNEALEEARLDVGKAVRMGEAMVQSVTLELSQQQTSSEVIAQKTKKTRRLLAALTALRSRVLERSQRWQSEIGNCYWQALQRNSDIELQVIAREREYLRSVHQKITNLRRGNRTDKDQQRIEESIQFSGLPDDFRGQDRISAAGYLYSQIDFFLRVRTYLKEGIAPHVEIHPGSRLNLDVPLVQNSRSAYLPFVESEDEFVDSAMRTLLRTKDAYLAWSTLLPSAMAWWGETLKAFTSLYRFELERNGQNLIATPGLIFKTQDTIVRSLSFSDDERKLFLIRHQTEKVSPVLLNLRLGRVDTNSGRFSEIWGVYDFPLQLMQAEALGNSWNEQPDMDNMQTDHKAMQDKLIPKNGPRMGFIGLGQDYVLGRSSKSRATMILPYNSQLDDVLDDSVKKFVKGEILAITQFREALSQRLRGYEGQPTREKPGFDLNLYQHSDLLLTPSADSNYLEKIRQFHQSTDGFFR